MFEGEKTTIFWIGLIILGLASVILFSTLWSLSYIINQPYVSIDYYWRTLVPPVVGAVVFILVGLYMMKSGTKKEKRETPASPKLL